MDGEVDRKDNHKERVAESFDLFFSLAERYNFYNNTYNNWSKLKMIAILCPATGFWIDVFTLKTQFNESLFSECKIIRF